jgi:hypothetical protein
MRRAKQLKPETFPFLAVLLCAMGSLILMLLVMDRRAKAVARAKAQRAAAQATAIDEQTQEAHRAELERRRLALHGALLQQEEELTQQMLVVQGRLEAAAADTRTAEKQAEELTAAVRTGRAQLARSQEDAAEQRRRAEEAAKQTEAQRAKAAALTRELESLEVTLAELKAARERAQHTYSLVPFRGKRGENRRPVYVECTSQGLVFHPDKTTVTTSSAAGMRGEVAHRIARLQATAPANAKSDTTPYILFLIRPDGIGCYYQTLGALTGLTFDYGYEFIERDWVLDFSDKDDAGGAKPWVSGGKDETVKPPAVAGAQPHPTGGPSSAPRPVPQGITFGGTKPSSGSGEAASLSAANGSSSGPAAAASPEEKNAPTGKRAGGGPLASAVSEGTTGSPGFGDGSGGKGASTPGAFPDIPSRVRGSAGGEVAGVPTGSQGKPTGEDGPGESGAAGRANWGPASPGSPRISGIEPVEDSPAGEQGVTKNPAKGSLPVRPFYTPSSPIVGQETANPAPGRHPSGPGPVEGGAASAGPASAGGLMTPAPPGGTVEKPRPAPRLVGNRDWVISAECKADGVVLYPGNVRVPLASLVPGQEGGTRLVQAVQQMIARKQATVHQGEPPYRPQVRFLVRPDGLRSFYAAYPWLEGQKIPMSRQNIDKDEEIH